MFAPVSVCVPVPANVTPPVPPITPPNVPLVLPFNVSAFVPRVTLVPSIPLSVPSICGPDAPLRLNVAPVPARFTALPDARLPPALNASVLPPLMVVPPV